MKFRKKPVVIDAWQWDGTWDNAVAITRNVLSGEAAVIQVGESPVRFTIPTLEGEHIVSPHDWIIKGVKGEFYPCKPDIFDMTYELEPNQW